MHYTALILVSLLLGIYGGEGCALYSSHSGKFVAWDLWGRGVCTIQLILVSLLLGIYGGEGCTMHAALISRECFTSHFAS